MSLLLNLRSCGVLAALPLAIAFPAAGEEPPVGDKPGADFAYLSEIYQEEAAKHAFYRDAEHRQPLKLVDRPIMHWNNEGTWSGDVFVWTHQGRPEVIGCMLSGPAGGGKRNVFDEFHLLAEEPIAQAELQTRRRWAPKQGLKLAPVPDADQPAAKAAARLAQMRKISRRFTAHMQVNTPWELRLLTQPLFRYGADEDDVVDGALFAYVWNIGTDPELILLLECRRNDQGLAWHYAPVQFTNRETWLKYDGREVWRIAVHQEPQGGENSGLYTTAYSRTVSDRNPKQEPMPDDSK
jgi:hypothetical protein